MRNGEYMKNLILKLIFCAIFIGITVSFAACSDQSDDWRPNKIKTNVSSDTLYVEKVENLTDEFIMGMDASCVPSLEDSGVKYYDYDGTEKDVYEILSKNGINYIRVRIWNDPFDKNGNGYGGGNCDIQNAIEVGKRATKYGMKLLVNFHYSDFWADPAKQMVPKAWKGMDIDQKSEALYEYTKECLEMLAQAGVDVGMVQIGNEITTGMFLQKGGEDDGTFDKVGYAKYISARTNASNNVRAPYIRGNEKSNLVLYVKTGAEAVKAVDDSILIMIQLAKEMAAVEFMKGFYHTFDSVPFDVIGLSYYPRWHGSTERLNTALTALAEEFPEKKVAVVEVSYAYTYEYTKNASNQFNKDFAATNYDVSVQGQANLYRDVIAAVAGVGDAGFGVFVWEGAWLPVEGAGWAAYNTKSSWSNQAFFGYGGKELPSIEVFNRAAGIK